MISKISSKVNVRVTVIYDGHNSYPSENRYVFRYNIEIDNLSNVPIKLLSRKWMIYDIGHGFTEVDGAGVIGLMPTIETGETFTYFSNVVLKSGVGDMLGSYQFENLLTRETFVVQIQKFNLISSVLSN